MSANVSGQELVVSELRVKFLVLDGRDYSIVDRSNQIVDKGEYLVNDRASPLTLERLQRPHRRTDATSWSCPTLRAQSS